MAAKRPRVLVTRPEPGAARTAKALEAVGLEPVVLPFTEIVPVPVDASLMTNVKGCEAVAVTSANALVHAPSALLETLRTKPVFAVGDATARAARDLGLADVQSADGAADGLARLIGSSTQNGARIAYLCGRVRTGELEAALQMIGREAVLVETYDAQKVSYITDKFEALWQSRRVDAVLFHSGVAASVFKAEIEPLLSPQDIERTHFFAISARVAQLLPSRLTPRIVVASAPRDDALIAAARKLLLSNLSQGPG